MHSFKRQSLSKQLMDTIVSGITANEFPIGEKLPPEAELAEMFSISRNTLREVLKTLEQLVSSSPFTDRAPLYPKTLCTEFQTLKFCKS